MQIGEILRQKQPRLIAVSSSADVREAARLMLEHTVGGLPVMNDGGRLAGFVAERDIVRALHGSGDAVTRLPIERIMQPSPTCRATDPLHQVMRRMTVERSRHIVVLDGDHILGVVSLGDLVKHRLEQLEREAGTLRDYVAAQRALR